MSFRDNHKQSRVLASDSYSPSLNPEPIGESEYCIFQGRLGGGVVRDLPSPHRSVLVRAAARDEMRRQLVWKEFGVSLQGRRFAGSK